VCYISLCCAPSLACGARQSKPEYEYKYPCRTFIFRALASLFSYKNRSKRKKKEAQDSIRSMDKTKTYTFLI